MDAVSIDRVNKHTFEESKQKLNIQQQIAEMISDTIYIS